MRTTVTLDPDVTALVARAMKERSIGFKEAVNQGLRAGLGSSPVPVDLVFPTFDLGSPLMDLTQANRVAEVLEDEAIALRLGEGR